jgi:hypothetical protein
LGIAPVVALATLWLHDVVHTRSAIHRKGRFSIAAELQRRSPKAAERA